MTREINFALVLNLHQPSGNLDEMLRESPWEAKEILWALDRIPRALWRHERRARVHLSLSGTLLETLADPDFQNRAYGIIDCGSLLWHLQNTGIVEILGTGYYHPVLPLTPAADWPAQLARWHGIAGRLFPRPSFDGFWPPEMGFCMEMIPLLRRLGYRYVLVDSEHVSPVTSMSWPELRYLPHVARYGDSEIVVVVRDRELSDAQESGMDAGWFVHEVYQRTQWCPAPPLVTTCTDGDNGGWFRNTSPKANFWSVFHDELMQRVDRNEACGISPTFIPDYLSRYGTHGEVTVRTGAWNTGWHDGIGFTQWTGSAAQRDALARVAKLSAAIHAVRAETAGPAAALSATVPAGALAVPAGALAVPAGALAVPAGGIAVPAADIAVSGGGIAVPGEVSVPADVTRPAVPAARKKSGRTTVKAAALAAGEAAAQAAIGATAPVPAPASGDGEPAARSGTGRRGTGARAGRATGGTRAGGRAGRKAVEERAPSAAAEVYDLAWAMDGGVLEPAVWRVLRAATSCNFYWGDAWVHRCHDDLDRAYEILPTLA